MRSYQTALLALILLFVQGSAARSADREAALALIDRAIRAHGGADALQRAQTFTRTGAGVMYLPDKTTPFKDEWAAQLPDRIRANIDLGGVAIIVVVNGDKGWQNTGGASMDLPKERLDEL